MDLSERERHTEVYALHQDLLRLRREDAVLRAQRGNRQNGAVLVRVAFLLRFFWEAGDDRLLLVNVGCGPHVDVAPEPLLPRPRNGAGRPAGPATTGALAVSAHRRSTPARTGGRWTLRPS